MIEIKERNKQVKKLLVKEFGNSSVSVTSGKGTAYGWCRIEIKSKIDCAGNDETCSECADKNNGLCRINQKAVADRGWLNSARQEKNTEINNKIDTLIKNCEFYSYPDDMGGNHKKYTTQIRWIK